MNNIPYITGHRNPDTDTIVSTIAYGRLYELLGIKAYPIRIGTINSETAFILRKFHVEAPPLVYDIKTRVCDITFDHAFYVRPTDTIHTAWQIMRENNKKVIAIVDEQHHLLGMSTISGITSAIMASTLNNFEIIKKIPLENIAEILQGELIVNPRHYHPNGIITIATGIKEENDYTDQMVVCDPQTETQLHVIERGASLLIVTQSKEVDPRVILAATKHNCALIYTPYDLYYTSQQICFGIPIADIMTTELVTFGYYDYLDDVKKTIPKTRFRSYPVVDPNNVLKGFISRYHLWGHEKRQLILVDHNEINQSIDGIAQADVIEIIDHHKIGDVQTNIPISFRNEIVGACSTIISKMYQEKNIPIPKDIAGLMCGAIISDTMSFNSPTCTDVDRKQAELLAEIAGIDLDEFAREIFTASTSLAGKSVNEIFHNDLKEFNMQSYRFVIGQINIAEATSVSEIKDPLKRFLEDFCTTNHYDLAIMIFTDVNEKGSYLICGGKEQKVVDYAFESQMVIQNHLTFVPNLMSRKKQVVPAISRALSFYQR